MRPTVLAIAVAVLFVLTTVVLSPPEGRTSPAAVAPEGVTTFVCSPGPFCGGGHNNLRAPFLNYPSVPALAPDGLPYGAVVTGATAPFGPASIARGTPNVVGVAWATTAGTPTVINANTFWGNQSSIPLVGNVTIQNGFYLTIYNSEVNWTEPASSTHLAYGFGMSGGAVASYPHLRVIYSTITQTNPSGNAWYVYATNISTSCPLECNMVMYYKDTWDNSTMLTPSSNLVLTGVNAKSEHGLWVSYFNNSLYNGFNYYGPSGLNVTQRPWPSDNAIFPFNGMEHSTCVNGSFGGFEGGNDTFNHCRIGINSGYISSGGAGTKSGFHLNWSTIKNLDASAYLYVLTTGGPMIYNGSQPFFNLGPGHVWWSHDSIVNWNASYWSSTTFWANGGTVLPPLVYGAASAVGQGANVDNVSIVNVTEYDASAILLSTMKQDGPYSSTMITNGVYPYAVVKHVTLNGMRPAKAGHYAAANLLYIVGNATIEYNYVLNYVGSNPAEPTPFNVKSYAYTFAYNVFRNVVSDVLTPLSRYQAFDISDQHRQVYNRIEGDTSSGGHIGAGQWLSGGALLAPNLPTGIHRFWGNWEVNTTGQVWLAQVNGYKDDAENNTLVNITSGIGIGASVDASSMYGKFINNAYWGVYNFSVATGSTEGGAFAAVFSANTCYDVDATSYCGMTESSNDTWANGATLSPVLLVGTNGTQGGGPTTGYHRLTSNVAFSGGIYPQVYLTAVNTAVSNSTPRSVLPTDFNVTVANAYIPSNLTVTAYNFSLRSTFRNPSFLNLTGFMGAFPNQTYDVNASTVKGENALPVNFNGPTVALFPSSPKALDTFRAWTNGGIHYTLTANRTQAGSVPLTFWGLVPSHAYLLTGYGGGTTFLSTTITASAVGSVNTTFVPATMPLNSTFNVTAIVVNSGLGILALGLGVTGAIALILVFYGLGVAAAAKRRRRSTRDDA